MIRAAQRVVVLCDSSKFGRRGFSRICGVTEVDHVITDSGVSEAVLRRCAEIELSVQVV